MIFFKCRIIFDEIDENIFKLPIDIALAHCVAQDLRMGAGIAVEFKYEFLKFIIHQLSTRYL